MTPPARLQLAHLVVPLRPLGPPACSKKFAVPEVDVEAAEAVCAEAACDPLLEAEEGQEQEEEQRAGSSAMSQAGSEQCASAGSTPACSSGGSSPRAGLDAAAASPAGPDELVASAASRLAAAKLVAEPVAVPAGSGAQAAPLEASPAASGSPGDQAGSLGSSGSRRSSLEREGRPSMAAVAKNWQAWVAVRDSPCPGAWACGGGGLGWVG